MDKIPFLRTRKTGARLHAVSLFESFHPAGCVNQFLLAGKERMTGGANLRRYLGFG